MADYAALQLEHDSLLGFLYMCPVGVVHTAGNGAVEMINPKAAQMLLPLTRTMTLQNLFDVLESCAPELRGMAARFTAPSGSICEQHRIYISRSGPGPHVIACTLLKINRGSLMAVFQDITQLVEQERQLSKNEAIFAALVAGVNDFALFSLDGDGRIDSWNLSGRQQTGYPTDEVLGHDLLILSSPGDDNGDIVREQLVEARREGWSLRERWCARRDGSRYWCQIMIAANREDDHAEHETGPEESAREKSSILGFAVVLRDVTERHMTGEELRRLLTTDQLTSATNRARFFDLAEVEITRCRANDRPLSAIMLDVDRFKQVNDCYGHAGGDLVLQRLVKVCRVQLRGRDVLARMGGEEFAVLLPDADLDKAVVIAERIREGVASELVMPRAVCLNGALSAMGSITVSLGCATLSDSDEGVDALLRSADAALYHAKRSGRDQVQATARPATPRVQN